MQRPEHPWGIVFAMIVAGLVVLERRVQSRAAANRIPSTSAIERQAPKLGVSDAPPAKRANVGTNTGTVDGSLVSLVSSAASDDATSDTPGAGLRWIPCSPGQKCTPPATLQSPRFPPPFDAPMRYDGEEQMGGARYWRYVKTGPASRACTAAERAALCPWKRNPCDTAVGEPLLVMAPFRICDPATGKVCK